MVLTALMAFLVFLGLMIFFAGLFNKPTQDLLEMRLRTFDGKPTSLAEVELQEPFSERLLRPMLERIGAFLNARTGRDERNNLALRLQTAGRPGNLTANAFISLKLICMVFAGILGTALMGLAHFKVAALPAPLGTLALGALWALLGYFLPELWLRSKIEQRQKAVRLALPNALDLLTISVEAGLGFDAALARVTEKYHNELTREFAQVLNEVRLGRPRMEALEELALRSGVPELQSFIQALIQSEQLGVGIAKVLRIQSEEMRRKRRQRAQELAAQASLKMLFPMVLFIFPTIFIVLMGPSFILVQKSLGAH